MSWRRPRLTGRDQPTAECAVQNTTYTAKANPSEITTIRWGKSPRPFSHTVPGILRSNMCSQKTSPLWPQWPLLAAALPGRPVRSSTSNLSFWCSHPLTGEVIDAKPGNTCLCELAFHQLV